MKRKKKFQIFISMTCFFLWVIGQSYTYMVVKRSLNLNLLQQKEKLTMKEPTKPNADDCCNNGCNPCIYDVYEKQLKLYEEYLINMKDETLENAIDVLQYRSFTVISNTELCYLHYLITFERAGSDKKERLWWRPGDHFLVKYCSGDSTYTRAYTPIKINQKENTTFSIIVKSYDNGKVSNYLSDLKSGDSTLWRGPYGSYTITPNRHSRIIIFAQGTGIAPIYSIISSILNNEDDMSKIFLFYCCGSYKTILLRNEFYTFKSYWNFWYKVFINQTLDRVINVKYQEPIVKKKFDISDILFLKPFSLNDQFLICGSELFMETYKTVLHSENIKDIITF